MCRRKTWRLCAPLHVTPSSYSGGNDAGEGRERFNGYIFSSRCCLGYCEKFVDKVMILSWSFWLDRGKTSFRSKEEKQERL